MIGVVVNRLVGMALKVPISHITYKMFSINMWNLRNNPRCIIICFQYPQCHMSFLTNDKVVVSNLTVNPHQKVIAYMHPIIM